MELVPTASVESPSAALSPQLAPAASPLQGALPAATADLRAAPVALAPSALPATAIPAAKATASPPPAAAQPEGAAPEKAIDQLRREAGRESEDAGELPGLDPAWGLSIQELTWATAYRAIDRDGADVFLKFRGKGFVGRGVREEARLTASAQRDFFDPSRAPEAPIDPLALLPKVRGVGRVTREFARGMSRAPRVEEDASADLRPGVEVLAVQGLPGRDLNSFYPFKESATKMTRRQWSALESVVRRLHALGYVHGDIAAPNVLIERSFPGREGRVALIDFEAVTRRGDVPEAEFERLAARELGHLRALKKDISGMLEPPAR